MGLALRTQPSGARQAFMTKTNPTNRSKEKEQFKAFVVQNFPKIYQKIYI